MRRILEQPGRKFTLAKLYELVEKTADLYTRTVVPPTLSRLSCLS